MKNWNKELDTLADCGRLADNRRLWRIINARGPCAPCIGIEG